jgi:hypothetical protein
MPGYLILCISICLLLACHPDASFASTYLGGILVLELAAFDCGRFFFGLFSTFCLRHKRWSQKVKEKAKAPLPFPSRRTRAILQWLHVLLLLQSFFSVTFCMTGCMKQFFFIG